MGDDECTSTCSSKNHGDDLCDILRSTYLNDIEIISYMKWKCKNYGALYDSNGKGLVHVAAAAGRLNLLRHLLQLRDCLNEVNQESGYSPLHYSSMHGHVHCAVRLIQLGANVNTMDREFLTPLDIVVKDKNILGFDRIPHDAYLWGSNSNYTLGVGHNRERTLPEASDFFRKQKLQIVNVVMQKFHTVFLDSTGTVWSCGHGSGGRLGHGSEIAVLEPKRIKVSETSKVKAICAGEDHTVFLSDLGVAWTCGQNIYGQLGLGTLKSSHTPKTVRNLPQLLGICAAQFHSVFWTENQLFTCGLNGGQLGHPPETVTSSPRLVTSVQMKTATISCVSASFGATAMLNSEGCVYLFHGYRSTRITPKDWRLKGLKVVVSGGSLDQKSCHVTAEPAEVRVALMTPHAIFVWRGTTEAFLPVSFSLRREILIADVAMTMSGCLIASFDGESFMGFFRDVKKGKAEELLDLRRLPHIYRAVSVSADPRGSNFGVLQSCPSSGLKQFLSSAALKASTLREELEVLLNEVDENDNIHDLLFRVQGSIFPAHKFIVFMGNENAIMKKVYEENPSADIVDVPNIPATTFALVLQYIYSMKYNPKIEESDNVKSPELISAYESYQKKVKEPQIVANLRFAARRLGVAGLLKELDGKQVTGKSLNRRAGGFDATLRSNDGSQVRVHKCILVARLEYFRIMLTHGWRESSQADLEVPMPGRILEVLVDFLYTDGSHDVSSSEDLTFLSQVLVAADELFCEGLKSIVEVSMARLITHRSAVELIQLAVTFNAFYLRSCVEQYICDNLAAFLEDRSLEILPDETLENISCNYRKRLPASRTLKSTLDELTVMTVKSIAESYPVSLNFEADIARSEVKTPKKKEGKKRDRRLSERQRLAPIEAVDDIVTQTSPSPGREKTPSPVLISTNNPPLSSKSLVQSRLKAVIEGAKENIVLTPLVNLDNKLDLHRDFPKINEKGSNASSLKSTPKSTRPIEIPKLSQRERRHLSSISSPTENTPPQRKTWATIPSPQPALHLQSSPREQQLADIIDSERVERDRLARLRSKPLSLTQLEDRAIQELSVFYNVSGATDERITIHRLAALTLAPPVWVTSNRPIP